MIEQIMIMLGLISDPNESEFDREWAEEVAERAAKRQLEMI